MNGGFRTFGELPAEMTVPNCEQVAVVQKVRNLETRSIVYFGKGLLYKFTSFSKTSSLSLVALVLDRAVMKTWA